jgi:GTP pyrophosphokinase
MMAFEVLNKDELYSKIELGIINLENLKKIIRKNPSRNLIKYWDLSFIGSRKDKSSNDGEVENGNPNDPEKDSENGNLMKDKKEPGIDRTVPFLLRENVSDSRQSYEIAKCCNPIPGDEVTGYLSHEDSIIIHKPKCPVAIRLMSNEGDRIISVKWTIHKLVSFLAQISMSGIDRVGLVNDLSKIISNELNVNMRNINISVHNGIFEGTIDLYVHHTKDLNNLIMRISNVKGIENVRRVEDFSDEDI